MFVRLILAGALCAASLTPLRAATLALDPVHTQAEFTVLHLAISKVHGQIPLTSGTVTTGPNNVPTAATATFDVRALDSHDSNRDKSLKSADFLDSEKYPTMTFVAKKIEGTPANFTMTGDLSMHGVTKPLTLKGQVMGTLTERGKRHVAYTASGSIDRRDWGMDVLKSVPGGNLIAGTEVTIEVEADGIEK